MNWFASGLIFCYFCAWIAVYRLGSRCCIGLVFKLLLACALWFSNLCVCCVLMLFGAKLVAASWKLDAALKFCRLLVASCLCLISSFFTFFISSFALLRHLDDANTWTMVGL
ncbi:unnamed protein product [Lathyrus oleraceus]